MNPWKANFLSSGNLLRIHLRFVLVHNVLMFALFETYVFRADLTDVWGWMIPEWFDFSRGKMQVRATIDNQRR